MDEEGCATQRSKQCIAHGTLIFSVGIGMTAGEINPGAMSYGYDRLRFIKPVFNGDTTTCQATIAEKREHKKPGYEMVVGKMEATNERGETVLVCEHLLLSEKRSTWPATPSFRKAMSPVYVT